MMRKFYSFLIAALMLAIPMGMMGQTTEQLLISTYATANNWTNGDAYETCSTDHVTFTGLTNGNNSKYYSSNNSWRHYEGDNGTITVSVSNDYTLSSVTFTYAAGNNGIIKDGSTTVNSGTAYSISGTSKTFSVGHSSGTKNGNVQITAISVTFNSTGGSTPTAATPTFSPAAGFYTSAQNVIINTTTTGATIYYTTDGSDPTTSSSVYSSSISVSANTTIKAMAAATGYDNSSVATANYVISEHAGTAADPYSVADARAAIDANTGISNVYATGIVSEIVEAYNSSYGNITYNISSDGTTTADQLQAYRGKSYNGNNFTSADDIQVGDIVVVKGNLTKYNTTYEFASGNQLVSLIRKSITVDLPTINLTYITGNGPDEEDLAITGTSLTQSFTATITQEGSYFEMTDGTNTGTSLTIPAAGDVITVRLKAGLGHGDYAGTLTLHSNELNNDVTVVLTGSVTNQTYTLIDESGVNGSISFSASAAEAGAHVTLTATPASAAYYFVPNSWSFFKDDLTDVTEDIEFVTGETNAIVMPAYNLHVDASFQLKPTYAVSCEASPVAGGEIEASPTSAYEGQTVTLSYLPETGYTLSSIVITKTSDGTATGITPEASGDDYTFTMPAYAVTATATFLSNTFTGTFEPFSGAIVEGDYLLVYSNKAMNNDNTTNQNKLQTTGVTPVNNNITDPSRSIVWHIAASETSGYWTIYNAACNQYVKGTATKTNVSLVNGATDDEAKWSVSGSSTYSFRCKANEEENVRYLSYSSENNVYGNYASGDAVTLYKYQPPVAPEWSSSFPTTASILTGQEYSFNVTDYITGTNPTYAIKVVPEGTSYSFNGSVFTFSSATAGTYVFSFTAANTAGSDVKTLTITVTAPVQVNYYYSVNGIRDNGTSITQGNSVTLTNGSDIANTDFEFAGWTTNPNDVDHLLNAGSSQPINAETTFYAVYSYTTVTGTTTTEASYVKVTSTANLTDDDYLIVYEGESAVAFDGSLDSFDAVGNCIAVTINNDKIAATTAINAAAFSIASVTGGYSIQGTSGKYIGVGSYNNGLSTYDDPVVNGIAFNNDNVLITVVTTGGTMTLKFNKASNQTRFRYYKSGQEDIQLYKYTPGSTIPVTTTNYYTRVFLDETAAGAITISGPSIIPSGKKLDMVTYNLSNNNAANLIIEDGGQLVAANRVPATVKKTIDAYTGDHDGWNFIASPVTTQLVTANIDGLIPTSNSITYDLYKYNEPTYKWHNYKTNTPSQSNNVEAGFTIDPQMGYLYANSQGTTITFVGTVEKADDEITISDLSITTGAGNLKGFHLVGNPFPCNAYTDRSYYVLSYDEFTDETILGEYAASQNEPIPPCTGIMVQVTADNDDVNFASSSYSVESNNGNNGYVQMTVAQQVVNRGNVTSSTVDKAVLSFNEGDELAKFYFGTQNANIYIPQNGKELAIVSSEAQGEMPVNFVAKENGQYTISINAENVEMNYLHLIDNMTGANVDLLANPSYTFNANTTDYASRFRLVFSANGVNEDNDNFAFINNGQIILTGDNSNATLQVIDMTGRIIVSHKDGVQTVSTNGMAPGVYVLQLINGNDVKTQKIVVR